MTKYNEEIFYLLNFSYKIIFDVYGEEVSLLYKMFLLKVKFSNLFEIYMLLTDDFKFKINCLNFSKTFYNVKDL